MDRLTAWWEQLDDNKKMDIIVTLLSFGFQIAMNKYNNHKQVASFVNAMDGMVLQMSIDFANPQIAKMLLDSCNNLK